MSNPFYGGPPPPNGPPPGPPYGGYPGYPPGYPPGHPFAPPPPKSDLPWIVGILAVVVISVVAVVMILVNRSGGTDHTGGGHATATRTAPKTAAAPAPTITTAAPAQGITYEVAGNVSFDLWINYAGPGDTKAGANLTGEIVSSLPWTKTVVPEPSNAAVFVLTFDTQHQNEQLDIFITLKRGSQVIRQCRGGDPCYASH